MITNINIIFYLKLNFEKYYKNNLRLSHPRRMNTTTANLSVFVINLFILTSKIQLLILADDC